MRGTPVGRTGCHPREKHRGNVDRPPVRSVRIGEVRSCQTIEPGGPDRSYRRRSVTSPAPGMPPRVCLRISPSPYAEPFPHITNRCRRSQPACPGTNKTTSRSAPVLTQRRRTLRASPPTEQHVACLPWPDKVAQGRQLRPSTGNAAQCGNTSRRRSPGGRYAADIAGCSAMLTHGRRFADRTWAIQGCHRIGRHIANQLPAHGQQAVDVPGERYLRGRHELSQGKPARPLARI
jgi:hypothetical protein